MPVTDSQSFTLTVVANEAPTATGVVIDVPPPGTLAVGVILNGVYTYSDAELPPCEQTALEILGDALKHTL